MSLASQPPRPQARGSMMDAEFDLSQLGSALWRNRGKVLRPTIAVALIAFAVVMLIPPKYLGESRVLVVGRDNVFLRPDVDRDTGDRGTVDLEAVTSQAQLVLSRDLAVEVINKLKLNERPEFDSALGGVSLIKSVLGFIGLTKNPLTMTPEERVLDAYYDRLNVYPVEKSRVIVIDFLSENPELAARVANAIADAYLQRQQVAKQEQVARRRHLARRRNREAAQDRGGGRGQGRGVPRQDQPPGRPERHDVVGAAARRDERATRRRAHAQGRRRGQSQTDPPDAQGRRGDPVLRRAQFRIDPAPLRAARDLARAACRAIGVAPRQSSAHQGTQSPGRRPRPADQARSRSPWRARSKTTPSLRARGSTRKPRCSISSRTRRPRPTSRTCNCARLSAKRSRSAICLNRIWPNIARPTPATTLPRRRPTPASFRAPRCRTCRLIRKNSRPC